MTEPKFREAMPPDQQRFHAAYDAKPKARPKAKPAARQPSPADMKTPKGKSR